MKKKYVLPLIFVAAGFFFVIGASAQATQAGNSQAGRIAGTVVDVSNDPVPDATVVLQGPSGDTHKVVTKDDGAFSFEDVTPGIAYQITVTAEGLSEWKSTVTVEPGQNKTLTDVRLRPATVQRAVTVGYSAKEVAAQQLKVEEQQRMLRVIPNMFVTYESHAEPLTPRMKFHLVYKTLTHPSFFVLMAAWAGVLQAADTPDWPKNAEGYGKRFGANLAGGAVEVLFTNGILASALHQDPRYFYQGTGTKKSRVRHAILAPFVCQGDNGVSQPNYSQWGGLLVSGALANAYYPESNRGAGLVFKNFGINMGFHVALGLAQEFIFSKFTSRGKH
ncbi:MAG TPA: carboxypeptidase-like regulatory domain-containing protein [Terriglobales bacterium]|nr:carboxypeptidase-like regulatory domain-containing protein [Terriglobales bacterium]